MGNEDLAKVSNKALLTECLKMQACLLGIILVILSLIIAMQL